jgi:hypothetical protein
VRDGYWSVLSPNSCSVTLCYRCPIYISLAINCRTCHIIFQGYIIDWKFFADYEALGQLFVSIHDAINLFTRPTSNLY